MTTNTDAVSTDVVGIDADVRTRSDVAMEWRQAGCWTDVDS